MEVMRSAVRHLYCLAQRQSQPQLKMRRLLVSYSASSVRSSQKGNLNKLQTMLYSGLTFETAWLLLTFCHVPAVDFLMAQLYPTCSAGPLAVFDAAVERCARVVLGGAGPAIFDHPLTRRRV